VIRSILGAVVAALAVAAPANAMDDPGAVYALTNSSSGNAVLVYDLAADGTTSVAERNGLVYVLNAGVPNSISGYRLDSQGDLTPLVGSRDRSQPHRRRRRRSRFPPAATRSSSPSARRTRS
jgi:hypothetical protein